MTEITRRNTLKLMSAALVAGASFSVLPLRAFAAGTITVLNWQGYGTDEAWSVKAFTEKTGIEVVHDYYSSESEMLTKLRTNPGAYDLVVLNAARCAQAVAERSVCSRSISPRCRMPRRWTTTCATTRTSARTVRATPFRGSGA